VSPTPTYIEQPKRSNLLTALAGGAIAVLIGANIYLYVQIDHMRTDMSAMHDKLMTEISNIRDASTVTTASQSRHLDALKEELAAAREQAQRASSQAKVEAQAHADQLARQLHEEEAKAQQQVSSEITNVKETAAQQNQQVAARVSDVATDVGSVKTNLASTQSDLQKTINDLKSARGDMGVQSGLIATNANELAALKLRGERNYFDIKLGKTKQPVRFGDVTIKLEKVDPKHNRYSISVMADDKLTDKKDKNVNEPVQFYTTKGGHIPYEIVINSVGKNEIVGYLSTPKVEATR
jgi:predicted  nucleic acid-binding Zn-ribbon protein